MADPFALSFALSNRLYKHTCDWIADPPNTVKELYQEMGFDYAVNYWDLYYVV